MRRILVERARRRRRLKRGGRRTLVTLDEASGPHEGPREIDLLALDEALDRLAAHDRRMSEIVMLRYFAGLDTEETARPLGISPRSAASGTSQRPGSTGRP
jgi:DNA-directed RNA polymerase specialized sigma24 family protein